jgi:hypothetical protein
MYGENGLGFPHVKGETYMRKERELAADCWYYIVTKANNGEQVFLAEKNVWLFEWAVSGATELYGFKIRRLRFDGAQVSFYIKPADGFKLPEIMQRRRAGSTGITGGRGDQGGTPSVLLCPSGTVRPGFTKYRFNGAATVMELKYFSGEGP